jgi:hypothetical protein
MFDKARRFPVQRLKDLVGQGGFDCLDLSAFLLHLLPLGSLPLSLAELSLLDLSGVLLDLPVLDRLVDEVRQPGERTRTRMVLDEPGDRVIDLIDGKSLEEEAQAFLDALVPFGLGRSLSEVGIEFVDQLACEQSQSREGQFLRLRP